MSKRVSSKATTNPESSRLVRRLILTLASVAMIATACSTDPSEAEPLDALAAGVEFSAEGSVIREGLEDMPVYPAGFVFNQPRMWLEENGESYKVRAAGFTPNATVRLRIVRDGRTVKTDTGVTFQILCCATDDFGNLNATALSLGPDQIRPGDRIVLAEQNPDDTVGESGWIDVRASYHFSGPQLGGPRVSLSPLSNGNLRVNLSGFRPNATVRLRLERDGETVRTSDGSTYQILCCATDPLGRLVATSFSLDPGNPLRTGDRIVVAEQDAGDTVGEPGWIEDKASATFQGVNNAGEPLNPRVWLEQSGELYKVRADGFSEGVTVRLRVKRDGHTVKTDDGVTFQKFNPTDTGGGINASAFTLNSTEVRLGDLIVLEEQNSDDTAGEPGWVDDMATMIFNEPVVGPRAELRATGNSSLEVGIVDFAGTNSVRMRIYRDGRPLKREQATCETGTDTYQVIQATNSAGNRTIGLAGVRWQPGDEIRLAEFSEGDTEGEPRWVEKKSVISIDGWFAFPTFCSISGSITIDSIPVDPNAGVTNLDVSHARGSLSANATQGWRSAKVDWPRGASDVAALCLVNHYQTDNNDELGWECQTHVDRNSRFVRFYLRAKNPEGSAKTTHEVAADLLIVNKDLIGVSKTDYTLTGSTTVKSFNVGVGDRFDGVIFNEVRDYRDPSAEAGFHLSRANPFSGVGTVQATDLGSGTVEGRVVSLWSKVPERVELRTLTWGAKGSWGSDYRTTTRGFTFDPVAIDTDVAIVSLDTFVSAGDDDQGVSVRADVEACPTGTVVPRHLLRGTSLNPVGANCMYVRASAPGDARRSYYGGTALVFETGDEVFRIPGPGDVFPVVRTGLSSLSLSALHGGPNHPVMYLTPEHWGASGALPASALPAQALPAQALPAQALPAQAIPSNLLPGFAIPSNALPAQAIPSNAIPSNALPAQAIPSNALPAQAIPSNLVLSAIPSNLKGSNNVALIAGATEVVVDRNFDPNG